MGDNDGASVSRLWGFDLGAVATSMVSKVVGRLRDEYLHRYHRQDIEIDDALPNRPCLLVANHGFGGIVDLNVAATYAALDVAGGGRPTTVLVHQAAWMIGVGRVVEQFGGRPASRTAADEAFAAGRNVLVFPGGDIDAAKPWGERNTINFAGRTGFARRAIDNDVPIVPIVTCGAGESLLVLHDGQPVAKALALPSLLRVKALPLTVSIPWGLSAGIAGNLPYLPLPAKLSTAILPAIHAEADEAPDELAARVQSTMQARLDELAAAR